MRLLRSFRLPIALLAALLLSVVVPRAAQAGCGCDHPPPSWSVVLPAFASPGRTVRIHAVDGELQPGASYAVAFLDRSGRAVTTTVVAHARHALDVALPAAVAPGPIALRVSGPGYDRRYDASAFTALPPAIALAPGVLQVRLAEHPVTVAADGTVLLPIDLTHVLEPTQFAFELQSFALDFDEDDVVFYNADGVDLTIFTLSVQGSEREWGSYHGWEVEGDGGLLGLVFEAKVVKALLGSQASDVLTYWRHEFHSYARAHRSGGSHAVDAAGFHPDGSLHVDHDHVVIAIRGKLRGSGVSPAAGVHGAGVASASLEAPMPVEPTLIATTLKTSGAVLGLFDALLLPLDAVALPSLGTNEAPSLLSSQPVKKVLKLLRW